MSYKVEAAKGFYIRDAERVESFERETLRGALRDVALSEWDNSQMEEVFSRLLVQGYAREDEWFFTVVRQPRDFTPFRVRGELTRAHTFRRTYEVARWFTDVTCEPQEVTSEPVTGRAINPGQALEFTGRVSDQDLTSLFGGVPVGGGVRKPDLGREDSYRLVIKDAFLMGMFTGGGEHEPEPFEHPGIEGLRLHWTAAD